MFHRDPVNELILFDDSEIAVLVIAELHRRGSRRRDCGQPRAHQLRRLAVHRLRQHQQLARSVGELVRYSVDLQLLDEIAVVGEFEERLAVLRHRRRAAVVVPELDFAPRRSRNCDQFRVAVGEFPALQRALAVENPIPLLAVRLPLRIRRKIRLRALHRVFIKVERILVFGLGEEADFLPPRSRPQHAVFFRDRRTFELRAAPRGAEQPRVRRIRTVDQLHRIPQFGRKIGSAQLPAHDVAVFAQRSLPRRHRRRTKVQLFRSIPHQAPCRHRQADGPTLYLSC